MKKLIYSFWSAPLKERWSKYKDLIDFDDILMASVRCLYLSVLEAKKGGFEIEIYTDHDSKYLFKELPVKFISTELSFLNYSSTWIEGKLFAISKQTTPFVYIDWDVFLKKQKVIDIIQNFKEDVIIQSFDLVKQHPDDELSYEKILKLQHCIDFSPFLVDSFHKKNKFYANTSILGFNNLKVRDRYVDNFLKCLSVVRKNKLGDFSKIIDQYLFYIVLDYTKATCKILFDDKSLLQKKAKDIGYTHLTFINKYDKKNQEKIKTRIIKNFPEFKFLIEKKETNKRLKLSLCTVVMNRLDHLIATLKHNLKIVRSYNGEVDVNVFDYNSTDGLEEYLFKQKWFRTAIENKHLFYYKNYEAKYYHRTLPKNIIHFLAKGSYLVNIDADNFIDKNYLDHCLNLITCESDFFLRPSIQNTSGTFGRIMIHNDDFKKIGGYNLNIKNYGFEDSEITLRLRENGVRQLTTPYNLILKYIEHSDKLRLLNEEPVILNESNIHNPYKSDSDNRNLNEPYNFKQEDYNINLYGFNSEGKKHKVKLALLESLKK